MRHPRGAAPVGGLLLSLVLTACAVQPEAPDAEVATCEGRPRAHCVRSVSLGGRFACAALRDQTVWCWGRNDESQLGYDSADLCPERLSGGQTRAVACHMAPLQVPGLARVVALSAGGAHTCAVLSGGELRCWGRNVRGQLGNGSALPSRAPVAVGGLGRVVSVAAGAQHTCAATAEGAVYCWGANDRGQLGVEESPSVCAAEGAMGPCARTPVRVAGVANVVEVAAGDSHTCARTSGGGVWCWGTNTDGQLGAGTAGGRPTHEPQAVLLGVNPLRRVRALAAGGDHTCATREDGAVLCWGRHDRGQLGVAVPESFEPCTHACIRTAVPIVGYEGAPVTEDPDAGFEDFDVPAEPLDAASRDAAPMDAGTRPDAGGDVTRRDAGDAGDTSDAGDASEPGDVAREAADPPPPSAVTVSAGDSFSCLSLSDGTLRCWGTNRSYELGNGRVNEGGAALTTVIASPGSAATNPLQGVVRVESGGATSCAVLTDRGLKCWGTNELGALGIGNTSEQNGPVAVTW